MAIRVDIVHNPMHMAADVYIWEELPNNMVAVFEPVELLPKIVSTAEAGALKPTLRISTYRSSNLLTAIADALAREGIKPETESLIVGKLTGKLEATEYHLEDLRTMLRLHYRTLTKENK
jgi:hypothetical protein